MAETEVLGKKKLKKAQKKERQRKLAQANAARYVTVTLIHDRALAQVEVDTEWVSELEARAMIATACHDFV